MYDINQVKVITKWTIIDQLIMHQWDENLQIMISHDFMPNNIVINWAQSSLKIHFALFVGNW